MSSSCSHLHCSLITFNFALKPASQHHHAIVCLREDPHSLQFKFLWQLFLVIKSEEINWFSCPHLNALEWLQLPTMRETINEHFLTVFHKNYKNYQKICLSKHDALSSSSSDCLNHKNLPSLSPFNYLISDFAYFLIFVCFESHFTEVQLRFKRISGF